MTGTPLFERMLAYDYGDAERAELMREVWTPTPFMVNVNTSSIASNRDYEIHRWCREQFGPENWLLADKVGTWQRGSATVDGTTWYGFATEALMQQFLKRWPQENPKREAP